MDAIYEMDVIPLILEYFNVNDIVICGSSNKVIPSKIINYSKENNFSYKFIDSKKSCEKNYVMAYPLDIIHKLKDYGAIFINDDPNWYTVFNELNIIKEKNEKFPLVFICHNIFPHKYQDSYINPNMIPTIFRNDYSEKFFLEDGVSIADGFYHATQKNTSKNGVGGAIKDFLNENNDISFMDFGLSDGIVVLYENNEANEEILNQLSDKISHFKLNYDDLFNNSLKNQALIDNYSKVHDDSFNEIMLELTNKENSILDYENKLQIQDAEINLKNTQIKQADSQLQLKDSQIRYVESKLINKQNEICDLTNQLQIADNKLQNMNEKFNKKESEFNKQLTYNISQISNKDEIIFDQSYEIDVLYHKLEKMDKKLDSYKRKYYAQLPKVASIEYSLKSLQEEKQEKELEIDYVKHNYFIKKLMVPISYLFLMVKSRKEFPLNFKLFKALRNSNLFDTGYYLKNNEDIQKGKWVNYFPLELHYVCHGFREKRRFTKRYYNANSKSELLNFILNYVD